MLPRIAAELPGRNRPAKLPKRAPDYLMLPEKDSHLPVESPLSCAVHSSFCELSPMPGWPFGVITVFESFLVLLETTHTHLPVSNHGKMHWLVTLLGHCQFRI